jgi:hypothetical protein
VFSQVGPVGAALMAAGRLPAVAGAPPAVVAPVRGEVPKTYIPFWSRLFSSITRVFSQVGPMGAALLATGRPPAAAGAPPAVVAPVREEVPKT